MKNVSKTYLCSVFVFVIMMVACENYGLFDKSYHRKTKKMHIYDSNKQNDPLDFSMLADSDAGKRTFEQKNDDDVSEETCFKDKAMILYYNFEKQKNSHSRVPDRSGCDNHGVMDVGTMIFSENNSSCGSAAYLWSHDIKIIASSFQNPPKTGISISMWTKLIWSNGVPKELFSVNGPHFGVLALRVDMDTLMWSYRRPNNTIVFSVIGYNAFPHLNMRRESNYSHVAATYNTLTGVAQIYVNGRILNRTVTSSMVPFSYWGNNINIGGNFRGMPFRGTVDEIKLFNYALDSASIDVLANECRFGPSKDNFEVFKRSKIATRADIEKTPTSATLEKDSLSMEPSFDDSIYKDVPDYDQNSQFTDSAYSENDNNVYERESDQAISSLSFQKSPASGDGGFLRQIGDVIN